MDGTGAARPGRARGGRGRAQSAHAMPTSAPASPSARAWAALLGAAAGGAAVLAVAVWGEPRQAELGGLCVAPSPLHSLAGPGRPCDRLALNVVTLPYLTGLALLLPRLPWRLAPRLAHGLAAAGPVAVLALSVAARPELALDGGVLLALAVLAATLATGLLHLALRGRAVRANHAAHLALASLWLTVAVATNVLATVGGR
jgi:hypothetical protein